MLDVGRRKLPKEKRKTKFIHVPVDEQTLTDFGVACELRGATMAGLLRQHLAQIIREEKERSPEAFRQEGQSVKKRRTA